ncbi:MAG: PaaI family thioesterase [Comamonadaceae bacterium]|nr:MAG: PaaI family thioesterase [Comamonadaceae bacterium]
MDISKFPQPLMQTIGFSEILRTDPEIGLARVRYTARPEFAHTDGLVVQGGLITAWLDNAMAIAIASRDQSVGIATLELKVSFLERVGVASYEVEARALRWGRSVVFLEADLFGPEGRLLVRASSTAKLVKRA